MGGGGDARLATLFSVVALALLYSCPADGDGTSSSSPPVPSLPIAKEIQEKDPDILYNADMHENAQSLFSRGDIDNPYLFTFGVTSIKLIEEVRAELTIIGDTDNDGEVEDLYKRNMPLHSFAASRKTLIKNSAVLSKMYVLNNDVLVNTREGATVNVIPPVYKENDYIVGIGLTKADPVKFDMLPEDLTLRVKLFYEGEDEKPENEENNENNEENAELERELLKKGALLKEKTIEVSKADPYKIVTWRDLQHINDDLAGDYVVQNDIIFPEVGEYGYENFYPLGGRGLLIKTSEGFFQEERFTGTFEGNNHRIEGLYIAPGYVFHVGLFGLVEVTEALPPNGMIRNVQIYHVGINADVGSVGGLIGKVIIQNSFKEKTNNVIVNNSHVYALNGAKIKGPGGVGGLIGNVMMRIVSDMPRVIHSSAHTDVEGRLIPNKIKKNYSYGGDVGGLIGHGQVIVENSYATGNVVGQDHVGGLIGYLEGRLPETYLPSVSGYATGNVVGDTMVGGLIGVSTPANIAGYAIGQVTGVEDVGGVVGRLSFDANVLSLDGFKRRPWQWHPWTIKKFSDDLAVNIYSTGDVTGRKNVGGAIGTVYMLLSLGTLIPLDEENRNFVTYFGYARGKVTASDANVGLFVGKTVINEERELVNGYFSRATSTIINNGTSASLDQVSGIHGNNTRISQVTSKNYRGIFQKLTFGDKVGQWTWVGDGKWPAVNIGDIAPAGDQPIE